MPFRAAARRSVRSAGFARRRRISTLELAEALLGDGAVRTVDEHDLRFNGAICAVGGVWTIYLKADVPVPVKNFVLCHELAHYLLGRDATEDDCDSLAVELLERCWGRSSRRYRDAVTEYGTRFERRHDRQSEVA